MNSIGIIKELGNLQNVKRKSVNGFAKQAAKSDVTGWPKSVPFGHFSENAIDLSAKNI